MYNIFTSNAMRETIIAIKIYTNNIINCFLEISEQYDLYDSCDSYESSELSELSEYDKGNSKLNTFNDHYKSLKKYKPYIKPQFTILPMYNIFMLDTI